MSDYPSGMDGNGQPGGRIRVLEDTDGDGQYDAGKVFLDNVAFPNGVLAWGGGVLVTAAPEIFYAADVDGDGVADIRQRLFLGFPEGNQQMRGATGLASRTVFRCGIMCWRMGRFVGIRTLQLRIPGIC
jgi:hypothetical protein